MERMKRIVVVLATTVMLCVPPVQALAVGEAATESAILAELKKLKWDSVKSSAESIAHLMEMVTQMENQTQLMLKNNDIFSAAYNGLSILSFLSSNTDLISDLYSTVSYVYTSYNCLLSAYSLASQYQNIDGMSFNEAMNIGSTALYDGALAIESCTNGVEMLRQCFKDLHTGISIDKLIEMLMEEMEKDRLAAEKMQERAEQIMTAVVENKINEGINGAVAGIYDTDKLPKKRKGKTAGGGGGVLGNAASNLQTQVSGKAKGSGKADEGTQDTEVTVEMLDSEDETNIKNYANDVQAATAHILDLASVVAAILAALFLALAFFRKESGQMQSKDAMLKVCIGFFIALAVIEIFSIILEDVIWKI